LLLVMRRKDIHDRGRVLGRLPSAGTGQRVLTLTRAVTGVFKVLMLGEFPQPGASCGII
jgi:hypothetical protein